MPEKIRIQDDLVTQINSPAEAIKLLAKAKMKPFTKKDWYAFSDCESPDPMIGEVNDFTIVLDGDFLNILHSEDGYGGTLFKLVEA